MLSYHLGLFLLSSFGLLLTGIFNYTYLLCIHSLWNYAIVFGVCWFLKSPLPRLLVTFTLENPVGNFCFSLISWQHRTTNDVHFESFSFNILESCFLGSLLRILFFSLTQKCLWSSAQSPSHYMHTLWVTSQSCLSHPDLAADLKVFTFTFHPLITTWMIHVCYLFKQHIQNKTLHVFYDHFPWNKNKKHVGSDNISPPVPKSETQDSSLFTVSSSSSVNSFSLTI